MEIKFALLFALSLLPFSCLADTVTVKLTAEHNEQSGLACVRRREGPPSRSIPYSPEYLRNI